jgi:hypothetical protein
MYDGVNKDMKFLAIDPEYLSNLAELPFVKYNSSPRLVMRSGHLGQALAIRGADRKIVNTGYEFELGKYSFKRILKGNSKIVGIIPRYRKSLDELSINKVVEITIMYIDLENNILKHIDVPSYNKIHQYFGFDYKWSDSLSNLSVGDIVKDDTILAKSKNVEDDNYYRRGRLLNAVRVSDNDAAEDGMKIRRSALDSFTYTIYEKRVININDKTVLANLYGDDNNYKPLPDIGEKIHDSGILAAIREYDPILAPVMMNHSGLRDVNPIFDNCIYVKGPDGIVSDIKVYYSPESKRTTFKYDNIMKYHYALKEYYTELFNKYKQLDKDNKIRYGVGINIDPETSRLLVETQAYLNMTSDDGGTGVVKAFFRREELDLLRVEVIVSYVVTATTGSKLTDEYGKNK